MHTLTCDNASEQSDVVCKYDQVVYYPEISNSHYDHAPQMPFMQTEDAFECGTMAINGCYEQYQESSLQDITRDSDYYSSESGESSDASVQPDYYADPNIPWYSCDEQQFHVDDDDDRSMCQKRNKSRQPITETESTSTTNKAESNRKVPELVRIGATVRERTRMHMLNDAFDALRKVVPKQNAGEHHKLSKIATLRLAIQYISSLAVTLRTSGVEIQKIRGNCVGDRRGKRGKSSMKLAHGCP
ncbi:hypothetical protein DPMN_026113 [Dreissena polymorpha]|uniref:BHLH domain-containing protein n=2 Tax=Dreissena polymorpha TaxID=45954 RepID=A0A9D4LQI9_DREPO|nr:hypothetical protein DPMN_026113 [Dreissena polymorpha]